MQKVKVKGQFVQETVEGNEQVDGDDGITLHTNVVSNNYLNKTLTNINQS